MKILRFLICPVVVPLLFAGLCVAQSRLAVPSYQDPGSPEWNAWAAVGRKSVGIMIVNQNNGDDTSNQPTIAASIRAARAAGIFVVGYVYTGYGQRDPAVVRDRVDAVYQNYLVDGIFFDEAPTDCLAANPYGGTNYRYYQLLGEYVRTTHVGGRLVLMNPGTQPPNDCWMSIANILVTAESSSRADYQANYQDQAWFHRYAPERFWHIVYGASGIEDLGTIMTLSQERGAGWLYVTDLGSSNPYAGPPSFWNSEAAEISKQEIQAPYATARPASMDESGNAVPAKLSFRWSSGSAHHWQILLYGDSHRNRTAHDPVESRMPRERIDVSTGGPIRVFAHASDDDDSAWTEVERHAVGFTLEARTHLIEVDSRGLEDAVTYQIRAFDRHDRVLSVSQAIPLSITNTQLVFDVANH